MRDTFIVEHRQKSSAVVSTNGRFFKYLMPITQTKLPIALRLVTTRLVAHFNLSRKEILIRLKAQQRQNTNEIKNVSEDRNVKALVHLQQNNKCW